MKTKHVILTGLMSITIFALVIGGCKKKEKEDKDTQSATDNEQAEGLSDDASNMADAAAAGIGSFRMSETEQASNTMSPCATVTRDTISVPHTITIDFGASNCTCVDGRERRGVINVSYTGSYFTSGSVRTVTFTGYYVNDHHIEGTHSVTYNGLNTAGNPNWTINASNMKVTRTDGRFHTWNSIRNREMIAGAATPIIRSDDIYLVTGSATGVNINGVSYTATITDALRRAMSCHWIESGKISITPDQRPTRLLDFGTSGCDNQATVTINNNSYNITLH